MTFVRIVCFTVFAALLAMHNTSLLAAEKKPGEKDPIYAVVNGEEIRKSTLDDARTLLPRELQALPAHTLYPALMNQIINSVLIADEARRKNFHKKADMKRRLRRISDQVLERAFLVKYIDDNMTEKALKDRYQKLLEETKNQSEVHARHILVKTEKKARDLIKKLRGGENFEALAKKHSTGPSGANGGDLGYFRKGQMLPAFSKAAFSMKKGKFSKRPVKTQYGWHVIKVENRRSVKPPAIEEVREKLVSDLSNDLGTALVQKLRKSAKIDIRKAGQSVLDKAPKNQ